MKTTKRDRNLLEELKIELSQWENIYIKETGTGRISNFTEFKLSILEQKIKEITIKL
tara:strand:+ start:3451 stop:3621 length:171 start_codon:yes stop_codon:yes gene_type:complete